MTIAQISNPMITRMLPGSMGKMVPNAPITSSTPVMTETKMSIHRRLPSGEPVAGRSTGSLRDIGNQG